MVDEKSHYSYVADHSPRQEHLDQTKMDHVRRGGGRGEEEGRGPGAEVSKPKGIKTGVNQNGWII